MDRKVSSTGTARMFLRGLAIQKGVLGALLMREIEIRWGRRNVGFAWVVLEPLIFALPVLGVWRLVRGPFEHGIPVIAFLWSGYLPILAFRHITGHAMYSIRQNSAMLFHQRVTPLDIVLGRAGLEIAGNMAAVVASFGFFHMLGSVDWPEDPWRFLLVFILMYWWCTAIALIIAAASEQSDLVEHIWQPMSYLYIFYSGFMLLAAWLPDAYRPLVMMIDPPLQGYEIIRGGLFGTKIQTFGDPLYLTFLLAILTLLGLWLMRGVRKHLELEV